MPPTTICRNHIANLKEIAWNQAERLGARKSMSVKIARFVPLLGVTLSPMYTSLPFPRSVQVLFLLITNPYLESEQGLRTLSRIKREENGVHRSLLHFGQCKAV